MTIKIFNTLTNQKEEFKPLKENQVKMYVCGVTVYDFCHVGHARAYTVFDTIRRYLEYRKYKVTYIQNFTDIDDKIINRANENKEDALALSKKFIKEYFADIDLLNINRATTYPKVSEHIQTIIKFIDGLIGKNLAYESKGDVYFAVGSFKNYGKLSKRTFDEMQAGARVEINEQKKNPMDFVLWKTAKPGEPSWPSPWGEGRPGWHIECSAMSKELLGDTFDIHGGGRDLIFPHHENEIAQSEGLTGKPMAKYWVHNGFVTIDKEKMSKSLGNFFTLRDLYKEYDPQVIRFFLSTTHYRSPLNFSSQAMNDSKTAFEKLQNTINTLTVTSTGESIQKYTDEFEEAMDDDFNTAKAIAVLFEINKELNKSKSQELHDLLIKLAGILGFTLKIEAGSLESDIEALIEKRQTARKTKDWATSDKIRDDLLAKGIILEDTPEGVRWKKV